MLRKADSLVVTCRAHQHGQHNIMMHALSSLAAGHSIPFRLPKHADEMCNNCLVVLFSLHFGGSTR